jgi:hypothetical protein
MEDLILHLFQLIVWLITTAIETAERIWKRCMAPAVTRMQRHAAQAWAASRAQAWPIADGNVEFVDVRESFIQWSVSVAYSYRASGERYSGYWLVPFGRYADAKQQEQRCPVGAHLIVRYHPDRNERSVVVERDQRSLAIPARA